MKHVNSHFKNAGNDENNILDMFSGKNNCLTEAPAGTNFQTFTEDFHEKDITEEGIRVGERTRLMLTHPNHDVTHFDKSFIEIELEFEVYFEEKIKRANFLTNGELTDTANINQIFVGFKNAVEIISDSKYYYKGQLINNYSQNEMTRESYAYNRTRPKDVLEGTFHAHSLWENVINMSPNICGKYINLKDLIWDDEINPKIKKVKFELIIPFTDQLTLQNWRLYPNAVLGEIVEEIKTSLEGLVWCQIPPENVAKFKKETSYNHEYLYDCPKNIGITNNFVQIGNYGKIVGGIKIVNNDYRIKSDQEYPLFYGDKMILYGVLNNVLKVKTSSAKINIGKTHCVGFNLKMDVLQSLNNMLTSEIRIPCLEMKRIMFEQRADEKGLNCQRITPIKNATNILMMFPRSINDITVFQNIMYKNCQMLIDKKPLPYLPFNTTFDGRFVQSQLMSYELDKTTATPELFASFIYPLNDVSEYDEFDEYKRLNTNLFDNTNFGINFQMERGNIGHSFEGYSSEGKQILVEFKGHPYAVKQYDTYLNPELEVDKNGDFELDDYRYIAERAPEMWVFQYCYWTWSRDKIDYHTDIPESYYIPVSTASFTAHIETLI